MKVRSPASLRDDWIGALALVGILATPLLVGAIAEVDGAPLFWPLYLLSIGLMAFGFWRLRRRTALIVATMTIWFTMHKLVVALIGPYIEPVDTVWIQNYKEAMYLVLFGVGAASIVGVGLVTRPTVGDALRRLSVADWLALSFVSLVAVYFVIGVATAPARLQAELTYARRFASLPVIYLAGRMLPGDARSLRRALNYLVAVGVVVAAFGLVERLVLGDGFWINVAHIALFQESAVDQGFGSQRAYLIGGVPANWITFVGSFSARRLVSSFLEPTTLAIFLALVLSVAAFTLRGMRRSRRLVWVLVVAVVAAALLLTFGKGGYLAVVVIGFVVLVRSSRRTAPWVLGAVSIGMVAVVVLGHLLPLGVNLERHLQGLWSGLGHAVAQPLGGGLGSTGFWGQQGKVGTDSTLGTVVSQTGVLGGMMFLGWFGSVAWLLLPERTTTNEWGSVCRVLSGASVALLAVGVVSDSATGLLAGAFYALFAGWAVTVGSQAGEDLAAGTT